jgi:hypothetical protein
VPGVDPILLGDLDAGFLLCAVLVPVVLHQTEQRVVGARAADVAAQIVGLSLGSIA